MKTSTFVLALVATMGFTNVASARDLRVTGSLVTARQDEALVWESRWVLAPDELEQNRVVGDIRFAVPLPEDVTMRVAADARPIVEDGHIAGVHVDRSRDDGRTVEATFVQKGHLPHGDLGVPFADGSAIQILDLDLGAGARIEIDRDRALDRRVGQAARDEAVRLTGYQPQPSDTALYLRGDDVRAAHGIRGSVVTVGERAARMSIIAAGVFVSIVVALVMGWRKVKKQAEAERADAVLAERIESLRESRASACSRANVHGSL
jgi:hypothetical protein